MQIDTTFVVTPEIESFLSDNRARFESFRGVKFSMNADGERVATIPDALAADLKRSYELFTGETYARKRLDETEERIARVVQQIIGDIAKAATDKFEKRAAKGLEVKASSRCFDSYVGDDAAAITVSISGKGEVDDLVDDRDIEHEALHCRGSHECIDSAMESWDWAAWLADERSPYHSDEFRESYALDQASIALEQFSQTLDESSFKDDVRRDLTSRIRDVARELAADAAEKGK